MTREEAAKICQSIKFILENSDYTEAVEEALDMAIEALEQEPTAEYSSDVISRQAVIDTIESWLSCDDYSKGERNIMRVTQSVLYDLPSVTPKPIIGQWLEVIDDTDSSGRKKNWHYKCSICGNEDSGWGEYNYCPICGAEMKGM